MTLPEAFSAILHPENGVVFNLPGKPEIAKLETIKMDHETPGLGGENDKYLSCHQLVVCNNLGRQ